MTSFVDKKATLILGGPIKVSGSVRLPHRLSCSTAGPGAGSLGIVIAFEGMHVKKAISIDKGEFELVQVGNRYSLLRNGSMFISEIEIQPVIFHAPDQAFFNLDNRCIYRCAFCSAPLIDDTKEKSRDLNGVIEQIIETHRNGPFGAVAITSGIPDTPEDTVERMVYVVRKVRESLPDVSIGVEPYITSMDQIDDLKRAGADEIKLNIESSNREIFAKVCSNKDYDLILRSIEHAAAVFGKGMVSSNIIIGMGETDEDVLEGVEHLASLGCVATIRSIRTNDMNRWAIDQILGKVEKVDEGRLLRLGKGQKRILEEHGLTTLNFKTMCHRCGCCDIVPFVDII
ncbi:MAG: radical SAM protein [Methanomassiliicoccales archaeon]|jgi:MoaA/NifB/PqqE/SkfB family radical SAM enzyme